MVRFLQMGRKVGFILSIVISLCLLTISSVSAKYSLSGVSEDSARAARFFISTIMSERELVLERDVKKQVLFTVANGGETASEVSIEYDVAVSLPSRLESLDGFEMALFCNGEQKRDITKDPSGDVVIYTFRSVGNFEAGVMETDSCELWFSILQSEFSETFRITIDVIAHQID